MSLFGSLITLLLAEKAGLDLTDTTPDDLADLDQYVRTLVDKAGADDRITVNKPAAGDVSQVGDRAMDQT